MGPCRFPVEAGKQAERVGPQRLPRLVWALAWPRFAASNRPPAVPERERSADAIQPREEIHLIQRRNSPDIDLIYQVDGIPPFNSRFRLAPASGCVGILR